MRRRRAVLQYTPSGLRTVLGLPPDTVVRDMYLDVRTGTYQISVEGPTCPLVADGETAPIVDAESL